METTKPTKEESAAVIKRMQDVWPRAFSAGCTCTIITNEHYHPDGFLMDTSVHLRRYDGGTYDLTRPEYEYVTKGGEQPNKFLVSLLRTESIEDVGDFTPETCLAFLHADSEDEDEHQHLAELQFPIAFGLYAFCELHHGGQHTRLYQILSCLHLDPIRFKPGMGHSLDTETPMEDINEDWADRYVYEELVGWYNKWQNGSVPFDDSLMEGHPLTPRLEEDDVSDG